MDYKLKKNDPIETPDDQKVVIETKTVTQTKEFTLGEKKREIESIDAQIVSLQTRKQELLDLILSVSSGLNLSVNSPK